MEQTLTIFDGHNDCLCRVRRGRDLLERRATGHFDLPRALEGGMAGGLFALFLDGPAGAFDPPVGQALALRRTMVLAARLFDFEAHADGRVQIVRSADALHACLANHVFAAIMHLEGAEAIDTDLACLDVLYQVGLRSLGPVWSRPNAFGAGVPFRFDHSPDIGPGLTDAGRRLIRRCNELGIVIDLSHLNARGFDDVAELSDAPLVASHCCAWALCPHARNLTDAQLDAIAHSGGIVGCNFAVPFLRADGQNNTDTPLADIVRHIDYLVERMGIDHVGFGSDFDGADIPRALGDTAGLSRLIDALRDAGYGPADLKKIACENWQRVLRRTWRPSAEPQRNLRT